MFCGLLCYPNETGGSSRRGSHRLFCSCCEYCLGDRLFWIGGPRQKPVLHSADSQPRVEVNCHKQVAWLLRRGKCKHIPVCKATLVMWLGTMSSVVAQIVAALVAACVKCPGAVMRPWVCSNARHSVKHRRESLDLGFTVIRVHHCQKGIISQESLKW
jgi:hypothetical protein